MDIVRGESSGLSCPAWDVCPGGNSLHVVLSQTARSTPILSYIEARFASCRLESNLIIVCLFVSYLDFIKDLTKSNLKNVNGTNTHMQGSFYVVHVFKNS